MPEDCLFCRIASGAVPATVVGETSVALAFRDLNPEAPVHVLVIPKVHITSLADTSDDSLLGGVMALAASVARSEGLEKGGYRVVTNVGADGGQSVGHLHFHVLGGRKMTWPPG